MKDLYLRFAKLEKAKCSSTKVKGQKEIFIKKPKGAQANKNLKKAYDEI